jgi:hypothetical protein
VVINVPKKAPGMNKNGPKISLPSKAPKGIDRLKSLIVKKPVAVAEAASKAVAAVKEIESPASVGRPVIKLP